MQKNSEILQKVLELSGCENNNQLAAYLSKKYGVNISRQQINQFKNSERLTLTHLLLREFSENA